MLSRIVKWSVLIAAVLSVSLLAVMAQDLPETIVVEKEALYPEGIAWDTAHNQFLVSSMKEGSVYTVQDDGTYALLIQDESLISSVGVHIDGERVLVANGDAGVSLHTTQDTFGHTAGLGIYDLNTGEQLGYYDLASFLPDAEHFGNDVAVDDAGNAYVTDSFASAIYRVTPEGEASVWLQDDRFNTGGIANYEFGLNGIVYNPDGYLLTVKTATGQLFRVPVDDPSATTEVTLDAPIMGGDGLLLLPDGQLAVVTNNVIGSASQIVVLASDDDWTTAAHAAAAPMQDDVATTAALRDDSIYAVYGKFQVLFNPAAPDPAPSADIRLIVTDAE